MNTELVIVRIGKDYEVLQRTIDRDPLKVIDIVLCRSTREHCLGFAKGRQSITKQDIRIPEHE